LTGVAHCASFGMTFFLNAIREFRHPEERPEGASRRTQDGYAALPSLVRPVRPTQQQQRGIFAELVADQAVLALLRELAAWPKPGLVSYVDRGSHTDMDAAMLQASAEALRPFFADLARAGQDGSNMARLRAIGLRAEAAMLAATDGVNTHRGAIFGLGLLCAATGTVAELSTDGTAVASVRLGNIVVRRWAADIGRGPIPLFSHGAAALRRSGAMARVAPGARRPVDFAASMKWVCRPCARPSPATLTHRPCRHALR